MLRVIETGDKYLHIKSMSRSINQANLLQVDHFVKVDSDLVWDEGDRIVLIDTDLGTCFKGKVFEVSYNYESPEFVSYGIADAGRTLTKEPVKFICEEACPENEGGTTRCLIKSGTTVEDAILKITQFLDEDHSGILKDVVFHNDLDEIILNQDISKAGQSVSSWIESVLEQTEGGVWEIRQGTEGDELHIFDYYEQNELELVKGDGDSLEDFVLAERLLFLGGNVKRTSNNVFKSIRVEGAGDFNRITLEVFNTPLSLNTLLCDPAQGYLSREYIDGSNPSDPTTGFGIGEYAGALFWIFRIRAYLPHTNPIGHYLHHEITEGSGTLEDREEDVCGNAIYVSGNFTYSILLPTPSTGRIVFSESNGFPLTRDVEKLGSFDGVAGPEDSNFLYNNFFIEIPILLPGLGVNPGSPAHRDNCPPRPGVAFLNIRYTYHNSFSHLQSSSDVNLNTEGEFVVQRPDLYKYSQQEVEIDSAIKEAEISHDDSSIIEEVAEKYFKRHSNKFNVSGTIRIHLNSLRGGAQPVNLLKIGTFIENFESRILSMNFDLQSRVISCEISNHPIRDFIQEKKEDVGIKSENRKNWRFDPSSVNSTKEHCFPNTILDQDCICTNCETEFVSY